MRCIKALFPVYMMHLKNVAGKVNKTYTCVLEALSCKAATRRLVIYTIIFKKIQNMSDIREKVARGIKLCKGLGPNSQAITHKYLHYQIYHY